MSVHRLESTAGNLATDITVARGIAGNLAASRLATAVSTSMATVGIADHRSPTLAAFA